MKDFRIVSDELRSTPPRQGGRGRAPTTVALLEGKTLFIRDGRSSDYSAAARHFGKRCITRSVELEGEKGLLIWWTDREGAA